MVSERNRDILALTYGSTIISGFSLSPNLHKLLLLHTLNRILCFPKVHVMNSYDFFLDVT